MGMETGGVSRQGGRSVGGEEIAGGADTIAEEGRKVRVRTLTVDEGIIPCHIIKVDVVQCLALGVVVTKGTASACTDKSMGKCCPNLFRR